MAKPTYAEMERDLNYWFKIIGTIDDTSGMAADYVRDKMFLIIKQLMADVQQMQSRLDNQLNPGVN